MSPDAARLFEGLFDDAGLFPPAAATIEQALTAHARHRVSWYDDLVATFSSNDARLTKVDECAARLGLPTVEVTLVVPAGLDALPAALSALRRCPRLALRAVDVPMGTTPIALAGRMARALAEDDIPLYVEIPGSPGAERRIHQLRAHGLRLKIRAGGTSVHAFAPEHVLAPVIVTCAEELLPFKVVTGISRACRHRDPDTLYQRHGFLNVALATLVAIHTGSAAAVRTTLAERDQRALVDELRGLGPRDVAALRRTLARVGSSHISESMDDLGTLGILTGN